MAQNLLTDQILVVEHFVVWKVEGFAVESFEILTDLMVLMI